METNQQHIYQVSELTSEARQLLEASYPNIWVEGEISNLARPASGHLYFSLKDDKSQIRCAFFRNRMNKLDCKPEDGMKVRIRAQVSLYENRGDFQLIVNHLEEAGLGDLQAAFEKLKQKLAAEGLFASEHKKAVPRFPKTIGIITSASGAAIKDIIATCERRYPIVKLLIYPVQVQGEKAAEDISKTITKADNDQLCDVLVVGRGGGSLEDLWSFNEEIVARAIFACSTPVISAVGHDIDFTISDFVADIRAATPTAAAELATPDSRQLIFQFEQNQKRLTAVIKNTLVRQIQHADMLTRRLVHPTEKLKSWKQLNVQLCERLRINISNTLKQNTQQLANLIHLFQLHSPEKTITQMHQRIKFVDQQILKSIKLQLKSGAERLNAFNQKLSALSPQSTLDRGYAIVTEFENDNILRSVNKIKPAKPIKVQLADGSFEATVKK